MAECRKEPVVTIGIDLAKNSMRVYGVAAQGRKVLNKKVARKKLSAFMVNQPPCLVAMEACGSAHDWARVFVDFGHEVRLIAPQFVKPDVKSNKTDAAPAGDSRGRRFHNGRGFAAWLGLVPRQRSTGGRERLLGISKRGDVYLRQLLIHGARAVMRWVELKEAATSRWAAALKGRRHANVAIVAMANKIARIAYAVVTTGQPYDPARGSLAKG